MTIPDDARRPSQEIGIALDLQHDLFARQQPQPGCGQLDGKWQTSYQPAHLDDVSELLVTRVVPWADALGPEHEQLNGPVRERHLRVDVHRGVGQTVQGQQLLVGDIEPHTRCREDAQPGAAGQELGHDVTGVFEVFDVVEHE